MSDIERLKYLKLALRMVGTISIFGIYPLTVFWPSGWSWPSGRSESISNPMHLHHLYGDVPARFVIAAVLAFLLPKALRLPFTRHAA